MLLKNIFGKMEKRDKFIIFIFIFCLLLFSFSIYLKQKVILEKVKIPASLSVGDVIGFDINTDKLSFGTITVGASSMRTLKIDNNYNFPVRVEIDIEGNIKDFFSINEIIFLDVGESKEINLSTNVLTEKKEGNYSGNFIITIKKSWKDI
ncbi:hypothetical protein AUJ83_05180 [Candidatus Woesearchaeota archaeon CG1_02_33_12]|nr:MAG: hypothetical protein AUJ83_05180 [Candidatus Woesearchaeota archaeon CG1_02_33_12]